MIILNKEIYNRSSRPNIIIDDLNNYNTTNNYYQAIWKHKYNVSFQEKEPIFKKSLINYLKGNTTFVEQ
jgi:hypothetical protein